MTDLFTYFDAWEPLLKARQAKGLDKWAKLKNLSEKLQGKDIKAISFTCAHPSHSGEPTRHLLGSIEGNLHFLLGYGNPRFHVAPYHFSIIDPNVTDDEATEMCARMAHPANPALWAKAGLSVGDEGDLEEGDPHKVSKQEKVKRQVAAAREQEEIRVTSAAGTYVCYPSEGLVVGEHNNHIYLWDMVKHSFFTAMHPEVADAMNAAGVQKSLKANLYKPGVPDQVSHEAKQHRGESYAPDVWPLVKSRLPQPGKVMTLETTRGESVYGVTTPTSVKFYMRDSSPADIRVFDRTYSEFELTTDGNVPPAALLGFITKHFKVDTNLLSQIASAPEDVQKSAEQSIVGEASPGWDEYPADGGVV